MMNNRKQPFGYQMEFGAYIPQPAESETVRWIYQTYLAGASYQTLVEALQERGVAYSGGKLWNKNMVARVLEDERYIGTDRYPAILLEEQFRSAQERRRNRAVPVRKTPAQLELRRQFSACLGGTADLGTSEPSYPGPGKYRPRSNRGGRTSRGQETAPGAG